MTFTNTERREYREYADAAEWFCDQGDDRMAVDALRDAVRAAGFDDSILTDLELLWILDECKKSDFGYNAQGCKLPADPWFLRIIVRRFPEGKILEKKRIA